MTLPAHAYAFVISVIGLAGTIVLAATSHPIPQDLWIVTLSSLTAGAGLAFPSTSTTTVTTATPTPVVVERPVVTSPPAPPVAG